MTAFITILFYLLVGHALADFPLQGPWLANAKRRHLPEGANGFWVFALTAHSMIHGGMVAAAMTLVGLGSGNPSLTEAAIWFGLVETACHWFIDFHKCEGQIGMVGDQVLHFICKGWWAVIAAMMISQ